MESGAIIPEASAGSVSNGRMPAIDSAVAFSPSTAERIASVAVAESAVTASLAAFPSCSVADSTPSREKSFPAKKNMVNIRMIYN